jgi:translocation and assembly module TamB
MTLSQQPPTARRSALRRAARILRIVATVIAVFFLFVVSAVVAVLLGFHAAGIRSLAVREVNALLRPSFKGQIVIERVGGLGLFGLSGTDVTVVDPTGAPVIIVRGVRASVATLMAVRSALFEHKTSLLVHLPSVEVDRLEVVLDEDPQGQLRVVDAFAPNGPPAPPDPHARGLRLEFASVVLHHGWVHRTKDNGTPIDVALDHLDATFTVAPEALEADIRHLGLVARRIATGADVSGWLEGHVRSSTGPNAKLAARVAWKGQVGGGIGHSLTARMEDDRLDAVLDVPSVDPAGIRALWADSALAKPASVHAEVHGKLSDIHFALHAKTGDDTFDANGRAAIGDDKKIDLRFDARGIDVHDVLASGPVSNVNARGEINAFVAKDGALTGEATNHFLGGPVAGQETPPATITARGSRRADGVVMAQARVAIEDAAMPTELTATVGPRKGAPRIDFKLRSDVADLDRVVVVHHRAQGAVHLTAHGWVDLQFQKVDAHAEINVSNAVAGAARVGQAKLEAHAEGALTAPNLHATLRSHDVTAAGKHFTRAVFRASGMATEPHIEAMVRGEDLPNTDARVDLSFRNGISLRHVHAELARAGEHATVTASRVDVVSDETHVDKLRVEGLGQPMEASFSVSGSALHARATSDGMDLGRIGRIAHLEKQLKAGTLTIDSEVDVGRGAGRGHARVGLTGGAFASVESANVDIAVQLDERKVSGKVHADLGAVGKADVDFPSVTFGGERPLLSTSWRQIWGTLDGGGHVDLAKATALLQPGAAPFNEVRGTLVLKAHVHRDDLNDVTPDAQLSAHTENFIFAPATGRHRDIDGVLVLTPPAPWRVVGIDFDVDAAMDGKTGGLRLLARGRDKKGEIADVTILSDRFPVADVFNHSERLTGDMGQTPVDVHLVIPERSLDTMPDILKQSLVTGKLTGDVKLEGALTAPKVDVAMTLKDSHFEHESVDQTIDFVAAVHYDRGSGTLTLQGKSGGKERLNVQSQFDAWIAPLLRGDDPLPWKASARAHFDAFPLEALALLNDKLVSGGLTGDFDLVNLHADAHARASLSIDRLEVGTTKYKSARIDADADGRRLDAKVRIDQDDGFIEAHAGAPAAWGNAIAPVLAPDKPVDGSLVSQRFRIAVLGPFVEGTFDEIDGLLDADTKAQLDPETRHIALSGQMALQDGRIEAVAGGGEFHNIAASVKFAPDGTVTLDRLTASGVTGQLQASASVRLDGSTLQSARGSLIIPSSTPILLSAAGAEIGTVDGRFDFAEAALAKGAGIEVKVSVPHVRIELPEATTTNAIGLGPIDVHVGSHRGTPSTFFVVSDDPGTQTSPSAASSTASVMRVETNLKDVQVVRGTELSVGLTGKVNVVSSARTDITGQIDLKRGGKLSVQGKDFVVESGVVTLGSSDPSNPQIVLKAAWTAGDRTVVYANFVGPLKTGKVTLTSEPALPEEEIVQLLIFGSADGQQAQNPSADPTVSAIGTAGGEVAQPLNHMFNQLGMSAVSVKVDTKDSATPKPEVEVQIARDISFQIAIVLGIPPPGVNPDTTLLTIDWRFANKWSLAATLGDAGTTVFDLLWQKRY